MGEEIPRWLVTSVVDALSRAGATADVSELTAESEELLRRWAGPDNQVRDLRYLMVSRERLETFLGVTLNLHLLWLAAVYSQLADDLTLDLVDLAPVTPRHHPEVRVRLESLGVPTETASRIEELVFKLGAPESPEDDLEAQLLVDATLAVFATSPQQYMRLLRRIRDQFPDLNDRQFLQGRRRVVEYFLQRGRLFLTPFANHWAAVVRENLEGERSRIDAILAPDGVAAPTSTRPGGSGSPQTKPTVIRRSHALKEQNLVHADGAAATHGAAKSTGPEKETVKEAAERKPAADPAEIDDTSTLEVADDLFAHRRKRGPADKR